MMKIKVKINLFSIFQFLKLNYWSLTKDVRMTAYVASKPDDSLDVQVTHASAPSFQHEGGLLNCALIKSQMVPLLLSPICILSLS